MNALLAKYNLSLYKKKVIHPITGSEKVLSIFDVLNDANYILADFFRDFFTADHVQKDILDIVNQVLNNQIIEGETGSQSGVAVYIKRDSTNFVGFTYPGTYLQPDFTMPTEDFKQIAIEWKDFLSA